jgi:hypothetical protein
MKHWNLRGLQGEWVRDPQPPTHPVSRIKHGTRQTKSENLYLAKRRRSKSTRVVRDGKLYTSPNALWPQRPSHCVDVANQRGRETGYDESSLPISSWSPFASCKRNTPRHHLFSRPSSEVLCQPTPIKRASRQQNTIALSTTQSQYQALVDVWKDAVWLNRFNAELNPIKGESSTKEKALSIVPIFCDNESAIKLAKNPMFHWRTKHFDVKVHFVRELQNKEQVNIIHVKSEHKSADIFTKPFPGPRFVTLR